ncbi:DUF7927 domain-containing protein [Leucobacter sp. HY1910]
MVLSGLSLIQDETPAAAAPERTTEPVLVAGTVYADATQNNTLDASGTAGKVDLGVAEAAVTLACATPLDAEHGGWSTQTDANGAWSFAVDTDWKAHCADDQLHVTVDVTGVAGDVYAVHKSVSADNAFAAVNDANQVARSTPFSAESAPANLDALVWPTWQLDVKLPNAEGGLDGKAVFTGAAPWDSKNGPGSDTGTDNDVVRSGDVTSFTWSITANATEALADAFTSAVFEQTIELSDGAVANFTNVPMVCDGTAPASEIRAFSSPNDTVGTPIEKRTAPPAGTTHVTLTCNLGEVGIATAATLLDTAVWASPDSVNGSTFTSVTRVYGVNAAGVATARPDGPVAVGPIEITSKPRYDLAKHAPFSSTWTFRTINGEKVPGRQIYYPITISTDRKQGVEAFQQPVTATEDFWAQLDRKAEVGTSAVKDLEYEIVACRPSTNYGTTEAILGGVNKGDTNSASSVSDSGTCAFERTADDNTSPYTLTFDGIDTSGKHYPTKLNGGADLSAGPYYVASYEVAVFIPLTQVDRANGVEGDGIGQLYAYNQITGFDPVGLSGVSNFGDDNEPGFCADRRVGGDFNRCDLMEDNTRSNNVAGPTSIQMSPGSFSKSFLDHLTPWSYTLTRLPGSTGSHDGAATIQPGEVHQSQVVLVNGGTPWTEAGLCDVFDNTTLKLAPLNQVTGMSEANAAQYANDLYAYVHDSSLPGRKSSQEPNQQHYTIEYGAFDFGNDTANNGVFDAGTNRFGGSWLNQANARCADTATEWHSDPNKVAGGIDSVNAIRAVAADGSKISTGTSLYLMSAFEQRDEFNGGPNAGQTIPVGTVAANYGQVTTDTLSPGWSLKLTDSTFAQRYEPQPESALTDGDRWTVTRAMAQLNLRTIEVEGVGGGAADFDTTGSTLAGTPVIWETVAGVSANSATPALVKNVVVTQTLPKHVTYNAEMTALTRGGTPATTAVVNPDGTTTLTWLIGDVTPNEKLPSRIIYTDTDALTPASTALVSSAKITGDTLVPLKAHADDHTVTLAQDGKLQLQKSVDQTLDLQNDTQAYTLKVKNFSQNLSILPVTVIEVLPYNGDAKNQANVNRTPASDFAGTSGLTGPVTATDFGGETALAGTTYYTSVAPEDVPQNLNDDDASIWFAESDFGAPGAPADWTQVTAFKFVGDTKLETGTNTKKSGLILTFETEQRDNDPGDLYANRFTAFSDTFSGEQEGYQLLTSNQTTVRVLGFSLGDLIWIDQDRDGKFDEARDLAAPAGVTVEVYSAADGGTLAGRATTNEDGRWILNDLAEGDYYAVIPAAEFASGGLLAGYSAAAVNSKTDADTDLNETADHHAINDGDRVRSAGTITLSASVDGSKIIGHEPIGDNVGSLSVSPLTTDEFTNLTLDLALEPVPGYEFTKTSNPVSGTTVLPGEAITYTLTGTNTGLTVLDPVEISDDLSGVLEHAALMGDPVVTITDAAGATRDGGTVTADDTSLAWTGALGVGESVQLVYSVQLNDGTEGVIIHNRASSTATPPGQPPIVPPTVETQHPTPGYTFWKSANPASDNPVAVGESITYTLTGRNSGETVLDPVEITDDLSKVLAHATLDGDIEATITGADGVAREGTAPDLSGTSLSWSGKLEVGETVSINYSVTVNEGAEGQTLKNIAVSTATPPGKPPVEPPPATTEHPVPGYTLAKTSDPGSGTEVKAGQLIQFTLTGTNTGATVLDPVVLTDDLSAVLDNTELVGTPSATIVDAQGVESRAAAPQLDGTTLTWEGTLDIGERVDVTYRVKVHDEVGKVTIENTVSSTATPGGTTITPPPATTTHTTPEASTSKPLIPGLSITGAQAGIGGGVALLLLVAGAVLVLRARRKTVNTR